MTSPPSQQPPLSQQHALLRLGVPLNEEYSEEMLREMLEDAVFEACTFFMMRAFVPQLAEVRIRKLRELNDAAVALGLSAPSLEDGRIVQPPLETKISHLPDDLGDLMDAYHRHEAAIKQRLNAAIAPQEGIVAYEAWVVTFEGFSRQFCRLFEKTYPALQADPAEKLTSQHDFNEVKAELQGTPALGGALHRYYSRLHKIVVKKG